MAQRNAIEEAMAEAREAELNAQATSEQTAANEVSLDVLAEMEKSRARRASARTRVYVVQAGDTLGGIAAVLYGDANRWNEIFEANKGTLDDPNLIQVGQELQIP